MVCSSAQATRNTYSVVRLAQLCQADVRAHVHVAEEANTWVLAHTSELVDHILQRAVVSKQHRDQGCTQEALPWCPGGRVPRLT